MQGFNKQLIFKGHYYFRYISCIQIYTYAFPASIFLLLVLSYSALYRTYKPTLQNMLTNSLSTKLLRLQISFWNSSYSRHYLILTLELALIFLTT